MLFTELAGSRIRIQSLGKEIQADVAGRHVAEDSGNSLRIFLRRQSLVGPLIAGKRLLETILPVVNVPQIDFQTSQPPRVPLGAKDRASALRRGKRAIVFAHEEERLHGTA